MGKNRSGSKCFFESGKGFPAIVGKVLHYTFPSKSGEWDYDARVILYEASVEITESEERLYVFDIPRFWPFQDCLDFVRGHPEALGGKNISEVFHSIGMKLTFIHASIESVFPEVSENLTDMFLVLGGVVGIDENVVKVDDDGNVNHIGKDVIHKTLESSRSVSKTKRHN